MRKQAEFLVLTASSLISCGMITTVFVERVAVVSWGGGVILLKE
jgi:hypothetical protein